ncbi:MAG TPA: glycosyltransferase [Planctomycetota bacterium]|nr:glycosyltransferase [Planctomycetota bacterium]
MTIFQLLVLALYVPLVCLLGCYGIYRARMVIVYLWVRKKNPVKPRPPERWPTVLVQIPVYNERKVVRRILEAVEKLDYPPELMRIQLLDDSTDETVETAARAVAEMKARGVAVEHIRRRNRVGFKAGALAAGLLLDDSEFVAIFDADFVPGASFLRETIPYFADGRIGLVQARWEHLNLEENLLTRVQSFFIDGHFILESTYRHRTGRFFNFNGTGGVWRRRAIDDAGGWSATSLAEDTELSIRAYLKGWRFTYLRDLKVPAELPASVTAYKSQQHRWAKGYTEIFREQLGRIWSTPIRMREKLEATLMLSNHLAFLFLGVLTILHLPLIVVRSNFEAGPFFRILDLIGLNMVLMAFFAFYGLSQREAGRLTLKRFLLIPFALGLGMALMVNSCRGVLEALFGHRSEFVRTPKEGDRPDPSYRARMSVWQSIVESAFGVYILVSSVVLATKGVSWGLPLNTIVGAGFLYLGLGSLRYHWRAPAPAAAAQAPETEPLPSQA